MPQQSHILKNNTQVSREKRLDENTSFTFLQMPHEFQSTENQWHIFSRTDENTNTSFKIIVFSKLHKGSPKRSMCFTKDGLEDASQFKTGLKRLNHKIILGPLTI